MKYQKALGDPATKSGKDEKIVKSFNFDKKVLCKSNNAYGFVQATNKAFEESINSLLSSF